MVMILEETTGGNNQLNDLNIMKADSKVVVILEVTTKTLLINLELRLIRSSGSGKLQDAGFFALKSVWKA